MLVTVATPTYNRATLLSRLYQSLCQQTCSDFEWLIVDDGSTDGSEQIVKDFISEGKITIKYLRKPNGGKHTAINLAVRKARGELFFIADSDDWLPDSSLDDVVNAYKQVEGDNSFGGVCGLDASPDGIVIGSGLPSNILKVSSLEISDKYGVRGDLKEVFRTSVIRNFPFPEIKGERFCPEVLVWNRIGSKYKMLFFNKVIYIADYQPGGITSAITRARMESPISTMMTYAEWIKYNTSFRRKVKSAINFWRFAFCTNSIGVKIPIWTIIFSPIGWLMHINDKYKTKS